MSWNVVTTSSSDAPLNFNQTTLPSSAERYERASEYVDVVKGLWDSWEDDAVIQDQESGVFCLPEKQHTLNHQRKYYSVKGPLNLKRPPQGYPVIIQAGSSDEGIGLAAEHGEVIFTIQQTKEAAKAFADRVRATAVAKGRDPSQIKVLPGLCPFVGESVEDAQNQLWELAALTNREDSLKRLEDRYGVSFAGMDLEGPLPRIPMEVARGHAKL